jgi:hypothetical protein
VSEWQPIQTATPDGTVCSLRLRDGLGFYELPFACFLHDDGCWYRIDPPTMLNAKPRHWKPYVAPAPQKDAAMSAGEAG